MTVQSGIEDFILLFHPELEFADEAELLRPVERKPDHEELEDFLLLTHGAALP